MKRQCCGCGKNFGCKDDEEVRLCNECEGKECLIEGGITHGICDDCRYKKHWEDLEKKQQIELKCKQCERISVDNNWFYVSHLSDKTIVRIWNNRKNIIYLKVYCNDYPNCKPLPKNK